MGQQGTGMLQGEMGTQGCGRGASGGQCGILRMLQGSCHRTGVCPALAATGGWLGGQAVPKVPALN